MTTQRSSLYHLGILLKFFIIFVLLIVLIAITIVRFSWNSALRQAERALADNPTFITHLHTYASVGKAWEAQTDLIEPLEPITDFIDDVKTEGIWDELIGVAGQLGSAINLLDLLAHEVVNIGNILQGLSEIASVATVTENFQRDPQPAQLKQVAEHYRQSINHLQRADEQLKLLATTASTVDESVENLLGWLEEISTYDLFLARPVSTLRGHIGLAAVSINGINTALSNYQQMMHTDQQTMNAIIAATVWAQTREDFFRASGLYPLMTFAEDKIFFIVAILLILLFLERRRDLSRFSGVQVVYQAVAPIMTGLGQLAPKPGKKNLQRSSITQPVLQPERSDASTLTYPLNTSDRYSRIAALLDLFSGQDPENIVKNNFCLHYALRRHPVLDIGAGTGTIPLYLAQHGIQVTAIEPSAAMRSVFITRLANRAKLASMVTLLNSNGESFRLGTKFPLIIIAEVFASLLDDQSRHQLLDNVWQHLSPKGLVISDFRMNGGYKEQPISRRGERQIGQTRYQHFDEVREVTPHYWEQVHTFETYHPHQRVDLVKAPLMLRLDSRAAVYDLFQQHGFQIRQEFSDYTFSPVQEKPIQPRLILIARKAPA